MPKTDDYIEEIKKFREESDFLSPVFQCQLSLQCVLECPLNSRPSWSPKSVSWPYNSDIVNINI